MAYCTSADIKRRIGEEEFLRLADRDDDDVVDAAVVTQAIEDAQGDIDSYLGVIYSVPIPAPVPNVLRKHTVTMAVYYLQLGLNSVTDDIQKMYDRIIKWLEAVVAGNATLSSSSGTPAESSGAPGVRYSGQPRVFGRDEPL